MKSELLGVFIVIVPIIIWYVGWRLTKRKDAIEYFSFGALFLLIFTAMFILLFAMFKYSTRDIHELVLVVLALVILITLLITSLLAINNNQNPLKIIVYTWLMTLSTILMFSVFLLPYVLITGYFVAKSVDSD